MRVLDVAGKDLRQSFRSLFALVFMFFVPILVTGLFYIIFGSGSDDEAFSLPRTPVRIANLDEGTFPASVTGLPGSRAEARSLGGVLVSLLQSDDLANLMVVSVAPDEASARQAVSAGEVGVAVIIPIDFTDAALRPGASATVQIVQDPTLTLGPQIVEAIVAQFVAQVAASKIGAEVTLSELTGAGVSIEPDLVQRVIRQFAAAASGDEEGTRARLVSAVSPAGGDPLASIVATILRPIMSGMMVFFVFFTGAASMQSILREEEDGTLARLFTTPTSQRTILAGKFLAVLLTLLVQVIVLLSFGRLFFRIDWGPTVPLALAGAGIVVAAGTMGLFLISWLKTSRQAGAVFGGVLTITGMLGLIPVFTANTGTAPAVATASLLSPQGWAMRALGKVIQGGSLGDVAGSVAVLLVWSLVLAAIGQYRLQRRFA